MIHKPKKTQKPSQNQEIMNTKHPKQLNTETKKKLKTAWRERKKKPLPMLQK